MTYPSIQAALTAEHVHHLQRDAARYHLGRLARRCRPATWRSAATSFTTWVARRGRVETPAVCATC